MIDTRDSFTGDLFPLQKRREVQRLNAQAKDRRDRAAFFDRLGYRASARKLEDQAVTLELRALRLQA